MCQALHCQNPTYSCAKTFEQTFKKSFYKPLFLNCFEFNKKRNYADHYHILPIRDVHKERNNISFN